VMQSYAPTAHHAFCKKSTAQHAFPRSSDLDGKKVNAHTTIDITVDPLQQPNDLKRKMNQFAQCMQSIRATLTKKRGCAGCEPQIPYQASLLGKHHLSSFTS
jgi:hypothetical protein